MRKGSLVKMKVGKAFGYGNLVKAYQLGVLLPRPNMIYTLSDDPELGKCQCGTPDCENGKTIRFEETQGEYSMEMFEEVQAPDVVNINELFNTSH